MGSLSIWHWLVVVLVVLLLFGGRGKISDLMGDFAKGIKAFKKGMAEDDNGGGRQIRRAIKTIDHQAAADIEAARRIREQGLARAGLLPARSRAHWFACAGLSGGCGGQGRRRSDFPCSTSVGPRLSAHRRRRADRDRAEGAADACCARSASGRGKIRRMASDFQDQFQEAMREAELADLKKHVDDMAPARQRIRSARRSSIRSSGGAKHVERLARSRTQPE